MDSTPATRPSTTEPPPQRQSDPERAGRGHIESLKRYDTKRARRIGRIEGFIAAVLVLIGVDLVADALSPAEAAVVVPVAPAHVERTSSAEVAK